LRTARWTAVTWKWGEREKEALEFWVNFMEENGKNGKSVFVKNLSASKGRLC